jgi:hypothetical protein
MVFCGSQTTLANLPKSFLMLNTLQSYSQEVGSTVALFTTTALKMLIPGRVIIQLNFVAVVGK